MRFRALVPFVMALVLAACTNSTSPPPSSTSSSNTSTTSLPTTSRVRPTLGVATGYADACAGIALHQPRVEVLLYSGPTLVASETIRSGASYRFAATPGRYQVKIQQAKFQPNGQPYAPKGVVVRAGRIATANFPSYCKSVMRVATRTTVTEQRALTEAGWTGRDGETAGAILMTYGQAHAADPALAASDIIDPSTQVWLVTVYLAHPQTVVANDGYGPPSGPQGTEQLSAWSVVINAVTAVESDWCMGCTVVPPSSSLG